MVVISGQEITRVALTICRKWSDCSNEREQGCSRLGKTAGLFWKSQRLPHLTSVPFALSRCETSSKTRDVCECSERYLESDSSQDFNQFNLIEVWMVSECGWCTQRALGFRVHAARSEEPRSHERCKLPAFCVCHVFFARWICLLHHHLLNIYFEFRFQ